MRELKQIKKRDREKGAGENEPQNQSMFSFATTCTLQSTLFMYWIYLYGNVKDK